MRRFLHLLRFSLLIIVISLSSTTARSQNWKCFQPGVVRWFSNGYGYIRGMRVDSVSAVGSDTVYHLYHSVRQDWRVPYRRDTVTGSWLGKNAVRSTNGDYIIENQYDTIIIKTLAPVGSSWTFFSDTAPHYYVATVISMDTMTLLGSLDSIKTIRIASYLGSTVDVNDTLNGFEITLSKAHGFAEVFDLFTFPYRMNSRTFTLAPNQYDWYTSRVNNYHGNDSTYMYDGWYDECTKFNSTFHLLDFHFPTKHDIYKFDVGDVFCHSSTSTMDPLGTTFRSGGSLGLDSVVYKDSVTPQLTLYAIRHFGGGGIFYSGMSGSYSASSNYDFIDTLRADTSFPFTYFFPEEVRPPHYPEILELYYRPNDTGRGITGSYWGICEVPLFEKNAHIVEFKEGFGKFYQDTFTYGGHVSGEPDGTRTEYIMNYSAKGSVIRGSRCTVFPLAVPNVDNTPINGIYPNPASDELTINLQLQSHITITIINLLGQAVWMGAVTAASNTINVQHLPSGLYLLHLTGENGLLKTEKLVVQH